MFEAIEARFGGNEATKKTQKTLLKQMYENFNASSSESLNSIFTRLQKIESQLAILVFDDLYNNFKIVEQEVKRSVTSSSNSNSQNVAFVSTPSSTNGVNTSNVLVNTASSSLSTASSTDNTARLSDATIYAFLANQPNGSQVVHEDLEQIHEDDLEEMDLKWQLALLSMKARKFYQRTRKKIIINGSDTAGYDKTKVECFNCHKMGHFARECRNPRSQENRSRNQDNSRRTVNVEESSSKAIQAIKEGLCFRGRNNLVSTRKMRSLDKLIGSQIPDNNRKGMGYNVVPPPPTGLFAPPTIDLSNSGLEEFKQPEFEGYGVKDETLEKVLESANVQKPKQADQPRKISQNLRNNTSATSASPSNNGEYLKVFVTDSQKSQDVINNSLVPGGGDVVRSISVVEATECSGGAAVVMVVANSVNTAKGKRVTSAVREQGIDAVRFKYSKAWSFKEKINSLVEY
ncbi:uncharacterized mitochondrial protein-like protein [Tanacetum coccineum]